MKIRGKQSDDIAIDMSPMIDMVFLLLIFFLVASQIVKVDKVDVTVPSAVYAKVTEKDIGRTAITIDADENIYYQSGGNQLVTISELKDKLKQEFDVDPDLKIIIRADRSVKYGKIEEIMKDACAEAGASDMIFAAFEQE